MDESIEPFPKVDWSTAWATLRTYLQGAAEDDGELRAADVIAYMDELKRTTLRPMGAWIAAALDRADALEHQGESSA
jgi:hypothetical protein